MSLRPHQFHSSILREYDIRGVVGETLDTADARALGRAFGTRLVADGGRTVCVGYDGRLSSPEMEAALVEGLCACGLEILRVGRGPSPMLYFAVHHLDADGGIMVTGSHNPPDYNGFKLMLGTRTLYGAEIKGLGEIARAGDFAAGDGCERTIEVAPAYLDALAAGFRGERALRVAWDAANGACGDLLEALVGRLPGQHFTINSRIDGTFPAHHPDPTVAENLVELQDLVAREQAEIGIGFDGDGDRIGVVDGRGRIIWGDQIIALLAREVLAERPGATIIADVKASQALFDEIARLGGAPLMWRSGHSLIKSKMAELGAPLAGELSGHIFFADRWYGFDDAMYVAVRLLSLLASDTTPLDELRDSLPELVNTPELRIDCADARKFQVVEEVRDRVAARGEQVNDIDGVRVSTIDGWWLLRASNTQPVLVARCEAADEAGLARLKQALATELLASGIEPPPM